jgi:glycyl-tRNA synthetase
LPDFKRRYKFGGFVPETVTMEKIVAFCKRRGFVYQSSEIYGGIRSSYDYGPLGVELKRNIKEEWWRRMVHVREDMVGLDSAIIMHPKVWEASGHTATFNDMLVESRTSKRRYRADHLIEEATGMDAEGLSPEELTRIIQEDERIKDPVDGGRDFAPVRPFNLMFETYMGPVKSPENIAYLRPETAQGIFVNFKNVLQTSRVKVPFGIAQQGKSFRNEITPGNFIFRTREFEQMEMEFFVKPGTDEEWHEYWIEERFNWYTSLGLNPENLRRYEHPKEKLSHYSKRTVDIEYNYPFAGWSELEGIANRTDYDLRQHALYSGENLEYFDQATGERFVPYVIEPAVGPDRIMLAFLMDCYTEEEVNGEERTVLKLHPRLAPTKAAVFPLSKKEPVSTIARELYDELKGDYRIFYDDSGSIGRRYRRQDEAGTPFCVTVDFDTIEDKQVTIRDRDTLKQERIPIQAVRERLQQLISG